MRGQLYGGEILLFHGNSGIISLTGRYDDYYAGGTICPEQAIGCAPAERVRTIKKTVLCCMGILCLLLSGCGKALDLSLDGHTWQFTMIQAGENGEIVACSPDKKTAYADAEVMELSCKAHDGSLTLSRMDTGENLTMACEIYSENAESAIYSLWTDEQNALATIGVTTYQDGRSEYTLIVVLDEYTLYFTEAISDGT